MRDEISPVGAGGVSGLQISRSDWEQIRFLSSPSPSSPFRRVSMGGRRSEAHLASAGHPLSAPCPDAGRRSVDKEAGGGGQRGDRYTAAWQQQVSSNLTMLGQCHEEHLAVP